MKISLLAQVATAALLALGVSTAKAQITIDLTTDTTNGVGATLDGLPLEDRAISVINTTPIAADVVESIPNGGPQTGTPVPGLTFSIIGITSFDPDATFNASGGAFGVNSATPVDGAENSSRFDASADETMTIAFNQDVNIVSIQLSVFSLDETFTVGDVTIVGEDELANPDDIYTFAPGTAFFAAGDGIFLTSPAGQAGLEGITIAIADDTDVLLGDVNMDGTVDFLDIVPFISFISSGEFKAEADIDQSGAVDFLDIVPFIEILSAS